MSSKEAITEEREDIYFKDIKEKLSDVHISVIEVSQALQGRKYEEAKNKIDIFVKLAQDTQRDFNLYFERVCREGRKEDLAQPRLEKGTPSEPSVAGPSTIRRNSIRIYSDSDDSEQEVYVATTSAQVRDFRDKEAIIQAIKDLETEEKATGESDHDPSGDHRGIMEQEIFNDLAKDSKSSEQTKEAALPDLEQATATLAAAKKDGNAREEKGLNITSEDDVESYKLSTSNKVREELDRAAIDMAESEYRKQKIRKDIKLGENEESFTFSDSREKERLEPSGGPMSFRHKKQFVQDWLSTDDHNLVDLLERRQSTGSES